MTMISLDAALQQFGVTNDHLLTMLQLDKDDIAYVSGSVIEGFGNPHSDLDIFVIKNRIEHCEAQFRYSDYLIHIVHIHNTRFDIEYHSMEKVQTYLEIANSFNESSLECTENLNISKLDFLHRMRIARPLYGADRLLELQKAIPVEKVCACLKHWRIRSFNAHLMDCTGMLEIGDLDTCVMWARQTLCDAIDVCLAVHLDTNPVEKWRFRKLERIYGTDSEMYQRFRDLMTRGVPFEERKAFIEEVLTFAGDVVMNAQLKTKR